MKNNNNRLTILTQSEIQDYFGIPRFTHDDREYFFEITSEESCLIQRQFGINFSTKAIFVGQR